MQHILLVVGTLVFLHLLLLTSAKELHVHMVTFFPSLKTFGCSKAVYGILKYPFDLFLCESLYVFGLLLVCLNTL